jgi:hypothetical protein
MESEPVSDRPSRLPRFLAWGGGLVLLLIVSFVVGFLVGERPVADLSHRVVQAEAGVREGEARAAELESRLHVHRALSLLYRTMLDLDARNFGTANERLDEARAALAQVDQDAIDPPLEGLQDLRRDLGTVDLRVADDLAEQREILSRLASRLLELTGA